MSYEIKPVGEFSPKLREAMADIRKTMEKHDIGGVVVLNDGLGHGEYGLFIEDPTWSVIGFLPQGNGIRIKAHMKTNKRNTARTVNMIYNQFDLVINTYGILDKIKGLLAKHMDVEEQRGQMNHGGYQPTTSNLDPSNPPRGGSGMPRKQA